MKIIDTHCHLNEDRLYPNRADIVDRCLKAGVVKVINNGDTVQSWERIALLAHEFPSFCYSAVGIHPEEDNGDIDGEMKSLEQAILSTPNLVALGEIGLDYHNDHSPETKKKQKALFRAQIAMAEKYDLPIIVHSRDADADTFNTIIDSGFKGNVTLHCYSGSFQMALRYLRHKKNVYFGIGGVLTFKNARSLIEVVQRVPSSQFLLETDSPFLTPVPYRGQLNDPSKTVYVLEKMAELLNRDKEELADEIYTRSLSVYGIKE